MSFPEGPLNGEQVDDGRETVEQAPTDGIFGALRHHARTWGRRYVEMRVEALTGRRES
jgi:hypothetical protein